ncbi:MAG: type I-E CRISPR-associated protein Cse1/CasA [Methylococcaceae bacterium]|jgi:CRISPR system Cascade subunit CasA
MRNEESYFNLLDQSWIPVRMLDGRDQLLGVRATLRHAREIAAIEDASPLVVAALYRLLLAVLYRALQGPNSFDEARTLYREGLPIEKIDYYLERSYGRFWLFDQEQPFGQIATFDPKNWRAWTVLAAEHNADNAKVLFDHINVKSAGSIDAASAARWLLAAQTFSVSAGKSELSHTGTAPSATAAMVLPIGRDLHDTLIYSLVPQSRDIGADDLALWEREPESVTHLAAGITRPVAGYADRYTWNSRAVRLRASSTGRVEVLAFASGVGYAPNNDTDPMLGYRIDDKRGRLPVQFSQRGFWRDFDSLLPDGGDLAPLVMEHALGLARYLPQRSPSSVMVLGQSNEKAKIEFWRMERFVLPRALSSSGAVRVHLRVLLDKAEEGQRALWASTASYARDLLSRGERKPATADVSAFVRQTQVIEHYWSLLEPTFHRVLQNYGCDEDFDTIHARWLHAVKEALTLAWDSLRNAAPVGDAWNLRALVKAERPVRKAVAELSRKIMQLEHREEAV